MVSLHPQFLPWFRWPALFFLWPLLSSCSSHATRPAAEVEQKTALQTAGGQSEPAAESKSAVEVLMINGGGNRSINYQSHLLHLKQMNQLLRDSGYPGGRITIVSADGADPAADLAVRQEQAEPDSWLLDGTDLANYLRPRIQFENSKIEGVTLLAATRENIRRWFEQAGERLHPGDTLFLYVTDHGAKNSSDPWNNRITLWGKDESLDVAELRKLLARLDPAVRVVQLMSQCYSGSFANLMYRKPEDLLPSGNVCGFFSSTPERQAYGCYPETRSMDNVGHSVRFIEALAAGDDCGAAQNEVIVSDDTPDVPLKTSDIYLESLLRESSRQRRLPMDSVIEELLHEAWRDAAKWQPEIRLLDRTSESFGYFSPRLLSELDQNADALQKVSQAFDSYNKAWETSYHALNRENLQRFMAEKEEWGVVAGKASLDRMDPEPRRELVRKLLSVLGDYTRGDRATMSRTALLKQKTDDTAKARYRMEVRQAVVLRLRYVLTGIAGRVYVEKYATAEQRKAYQDLVRCEGFAPAGSGSKSSPADRTYRRPAPAFPSYDQELELGKSILPGWIGVQYNASGAITVTSVNSESPGRNAGLQPGDVILGPPGEPFSGRDRMREWVMTAPIGVPRPLLIQRGGEQLQVSITPMPEPVRWPDPPRPAQAGNPAPSLEKLRAYRGTLPAGESGESSYLLFFFATWCTYCKNSLPELAEFERERGTPVIAITDESAEKLDPFFKNQKGYFPASTMRDELRSTFQAYGVNGLPTYVLVERGKVRSIAVGYRADRGIQIEGWRR